MSDVYEMNGAVRVQGRPGVISTDGVNWCYTFTFLANCSSPICDLSITTEDTGSGPFPGVIALNPDINPQEPGEKDRQKGVKPGISVERGEFGADGTYKRAAEQGTWTREPINGKAPDKSKNADEVKLMFSPCIEKGKALRVTLCFDEELDENDFVTFIPSFENGSSPASGDTKPSTAIPLSELLKILGQLAGAAMPGVGKRMPNEKKKELISQAFTLSPKLAELVPADRRVNLADVARREGVGGIVEAVPADALIKALGVGRIVREVPAEDFVEIAGSERLARALKQLGLEKEVIELLGRTD